MEWIQKKNEEALAKYKENTQQGIQDFLPGLRANLVLHTQVTAGPFDLSQVNFDCLYQFTNTDLNFNIYNSSRANWEEFWKECRGFQKLFYNQNMNVSDLDSSGESILGEN